MPVITASVVCGSVIVYFTGLCVNLFYCQKFYSLVFFFYFVCKLTLYTDRSFHLEFYYFL